jgi:hypothetical protein
MLKTIVQQSQSLVAFISAFNIALYQPQKRVVPRKEVAE